MTFNYPVWGEGSAAIAPQIYNWAQADRAEQSANIGRRTAYDAALADNARQYYQFARSNDAQDYQRQHEAEQQTYARQQVAEEMARRERDFARQLKFSEDELKNRKSIADEQQATKLLIDNFRTREKGQQDLAGGINWLHEGLGSGELIQHTPEQLSQMSGVPLPQVAALHQQYSASFPEKARDAVNLQIAQMVAKTKPANLNVENLRRYGEQLLPAPIRATSVFNERTFRFEDRNAPFDMSAPSPGVDVDAVTKGWEGKLPEFNFGTPPDNAITGSSPRQFVPSETGTYPFGGQDGGSVLMLNPGGATVRVPIGRVDEALKNQYRRL